MGFGREGTRTRGPSTFKGVRVKHSGWRGGPMLKGQRVGGPEVKGLGSGGRDLDGRTVGPGWRSGGKTAGVRDKGVRSAPGLRGVRARLEGWPDHQERGKGSGKSTREGIRVV
jgi:hypothetical protein